MDEPTASLSAAECEHLFRIIRELAADGVAILYVSHRLDEILALCDRVTVFRNGTRVLTGARDQFTRATLVRAIVGRDVQQPAQPSAPAQRKPQHVLLEAKGICRGIVRHVSLRLHAGEVLGLAGLVGSGRTEVARLLCGADPLEAGEIYLNSAYLHLRSPYDAVRNGIVLIPEDRRLQGLIPKRTVAFNVNLSALRHVRLLRHTPFVSPQRSAIQARQIADRLNIKTAGVRSEVWRLSGGNQQKVVIGKGLSVQAQVFILDEFTRGVDVGARAEIHSIVRDLASRDIGVILISSEIEELCGLCDRVIVLSQGQAAGELIGEQISKDAIMRLCYAAPLEDRGHAPR